MESTRARAIDTPADLAGVAVGGARDRDWPPRPPARVSPAPTRSRPHSAQVARTTSGPRATDYKTVSYVDRIRIPLTILTTHTVC